MIKKYLRYLLLYVLVFACFAAIAIINDAKTNGFFTVIKPHDTLPSTGVTPHVIVASKMPYLGVVDLALEVSHEGTFTFRIKEVGSNQWYYQQSYDTEKINGYKLYPFGFPPIIDSANKEYLIEIDSTKGSQVRFHINENGTHILTRHTLPKNYLLKNPVQLEEFITNKFFSTIENNLTWFSYSIILYALFLGIFYNSTGDDRITLFGSLFAIPDKKYSKKGLVIFATAIILFVYVHFFALHSVTFLYLELLAWILVVIYNKLSSSIFFLLSFIALLISLLAIFLGMTEFAENTSQWIWVYFVMGIVYSYFSTIRVNEVIKPAMLSMKQVTKWQIIAAASAILVSGIVVISAKSHVYFLGGDDSKLYYVYPYEFIVNFVSKLGPDAAPSGLVSLLPPSSIAPFVLMLFSIKALFPIINLQVFFFLLNLGGGVVFFYLMFGELFEGKNEWKWTVIKSIGSFMYVFSVFNFYTLLNSLLIAQYLIFGFPVTMYFYIRGIKERKVAYISISAIVISVFCFFSASLPWFAAACIVFLPFIINVFIQYKASFVKYSIILGFLVLLLNAYWLLQLSNSAVIHTNSQTKSSLISNSFRKETEEGIKAGALHNKVFYPLLNTYFYDIQKDFQWSQLTLYETWYKYVIPFNIIFPLSVLLAGVFVKKGTRSASNYYLSIISLLLALYFLTVNITSWSLDIFLWLTMHVPGFVMFRNMFDKFPYALSLSYALAMVISLSILIEQLPSKRAVQILFTTIFFVIFINALPFIRGDFLNLPIWTTHKSFSKIHDLNKDYLALVSYVKKQSNASRYFWFPIAHGNIAQIPDDAYDDYYYHGISPFLILSGKNDFSGELSFENFGKPLVTNIMTKKYENVGNMLQKFNARYVIVNNTVTNDFQRSYIYSEGLYKAQTKELKKELLGTRLANFGTRYSLYEINNKYLSDKLYVTEAISHIPKGNHQLRYEKKSSNEYLLRLDHVPISDMYLVFLDPYLRGWSVYSANKTISLYAGEHLQPFSYANAWKLKFTEIKKKLPTSEYSINADGTYSISLALLFVSPPIFTYAKYLSVATYVVLLSYLGFFFIRQLSLHIHKTDKSL